MKLQLKIDIYIYILYVFFNLFVEKLLVVLVINIEICGKTVSLKYCIV